MFVDSGILQAGFNLNLDSLVYRVGSDGCFPSLTYATPAHSSGIANVTFFVATMKCVKVPPFRVGFQFEAGLGWLRV